VLSIPHVSCHSDFICDFKVFNDYVFTEDLWLGATQFQWQFHASMMTLFSLLISCVNRELVFVVDSISQPRLNFQRWFLVLQWLSFQWRFLDQHWQSVCDNSILNHQSNYAIDLLRRSCCRFHTSAVTQISFVISRSSTIPSVSRHSIFQDDFSFSCHSVFGDDFWISIRRVCFTFPCVTHESIFAIDLLHRWCCWLHTSAVT